MRKAYPDVPGMADYCVYWFRRTQDHLADCTKKEPFRGRAGLVGTQNIRNNASRRGGLDHIASTGTIVEAVENQPWSGEANVHVSIVNWIKGSDSEVLPKRRRLWTVVPKTDPRIALLRHPGVAAAKDYELALREVPQINSALSDEPDLSEVAPLATNTEPQVAFQGVVTGYGGFVVSLKQRAALVANDKRNADVVRPYLIGRDLLSGNGAPSRASSILEAGR